MIATLDQFQVAWDSLRRCLLIGGGAWVAMMNSSQGGGTASENGKWKLVWSEEFDSDGLPDSQKWGYETGFVRNQESQYYTHDRRENARVENGMLILEARKESFIPDKGPSAAYTSGSLTTRNKASWKYGRIEVRAKMPKGKGVWPAIWMLGTSYGNDQDWPMCGEIDILEYVGKEPDHIYATIHYGESREGHKKDMGRYVTPSPFNDFHVYSIDWNSDKIEYFFDGFKYHTTQLDQAGAGEKNPFRQPFYLILNLALGGSWGGEIDDAILPQSYLIDYVRVYERAEASPAATAGQRTAPPP